LIGNELEIEFTGLSLEPVEPLLSESGVIMLPPFVHVLLAKFAPAVDQTRKFVGHGGDGFWRAESCPEASIVGAQGAWTVQQMLRSQAQGGGGAVDHVAGAAFEHFAPADPVVGTHTEPGGQVLFRLPPVHVETDLGHERLGGEPLDAVNAGQVDATDAVELGVQVNVRLVASGLLGPRLGGGRGVVVDLDLAVKGGEVGFDAGVALGDFLLVYFVEFQGLAPIAEPLVAPVALQTFGEGVGAGFAAIVFEGRELGGVPFASQQGAENGQARHTADGTDDMGELDVYVGEGLVPVLDAGSRGADGG